MTTIHTLIVATALLVSAAAHAQQPPQSGSHGSRHAAQAAPRTEGEVRKLDLAEGKVTLRHGPLLNLDMPAMTMAFKAADRKLLDGLKEGDKVRFTADRQNGAFVVTAIEPAK